MKSCLFLAGFIAVSICSDAQIKLLTADAKYENVRVALEEKYSSYNRVMITKVLITPKLYLNSNEHYTNQGKDGLNIPIAQLNKSGTQLLYSHAETPDLKNSDVLEFLSWILEEGQPILAKHGYYPLDANKIEQQRRHIKSLKETISTSSCDGLSTLNYERKRKQKALTP